MSIEEAIKTAIRFETNVESVYRNAVEEATDPIGRKVFSVLADEEKGHLGYLNHRLEEFERTGKVTVAELRTAIPPEDMIRDSVSSLKHRMAEEDRGRELQMLYKARDVEEKTSDFYKKMVRELSPEGQELFRRFVEIEEGHMAIVQAEIDYLSGTGHWFDFREISMES